MATVADSGYPNLVNVAQRTDPDGKITRYIADTLSKLMPMISDIPWVEGNLPTGHQITSATALPSPTWRNVNQGLNPTKGVTKKFVESCGILEAHSKIDCEVANLGGDPAAYRMSEDKMLMEGMSQEFARALLYESVLTNPNRIHGFTARYTASTGYTTSPYVVKSGTLASSNCYSIWLVTWDEERVFGIYPKGSKAGLVYKDLGEKLIRDANSLDFLAYVGQYIWHPGLAIKDYRYVVRLQWDSSDAGQTDSAKLLYLSLINALGTLFVQNGRTRIYMNRATRNKLTSQLTSNSLNTYAITAGPDGGLVESFMGYPVRITDHLVAETAIS